MIYKGLDDDEAGFLNFVAQRQADNEADAIQREMKEVSEYRVSTITIKMSHTPPWSQMRDLCAYLSFIVFIPS